MGATTQFNPFGKATLNLVQDRRVSFAQPPHRQNSTVENLVTERIPEQELKQALEDSKAHIDIDSGDTVGSYRILEKLGEGGMGSVFLAEQREPVRRRVALKIVRLGMDTKEVIARFESERQAIALMSHPNVAAVLDAGATEFGRPYFVMEYVPGIPITEYCDEHRLGVEQRLELFIQACEGIQHAHHKGIIHRDIKPGNILVTEKDNRPVVKVIDFGVAKSTQQRLVTETIHTRLGMFIGTPNYTSPEQAKASVMDVDTRADVYSLGVMLYELLVGELPFHPKTFSGKPLHEIQRIIREDDPPTPTAKFDSMGPAKNAVARNRNIDDSRLRRQLKGDIAWIALCAMDKDRNRRYPSAFALARDIKRFLASEPIEARPPSRLYRFQKFARRNLIGVITGIIAIVSLVATSAAMTGLYLKARAAEVSAQQEAESARQVSGFLTNMFELADPNLTRGRQVTARELLDRGAQRIRTQLQDQPLVRARMMRTISTIYEELALYPQALSLALEAQQLYESELPAIDHELALNLNNLGNIYESQGQFDRAIDYFQQALAIERTVLGPDHPMVAANLGDVAGITGVLGRHDEAIALLHQALEINRNALGSEHPDVAGDLASIGEILEDQGRYEQAVNYYLRALAINERALGADHPDVGGDLADLGSVYLNLGQNDKAIEHFLRSLVMVEKTFGPHHPDVAESLHGLGEALADNGAQEQAAEHLERALAIRHASFGPEHDETLDTVLVLANLYRDTSRMAQAGALYRQLLAINESHRPEDFQGDYDEYLEVAGEESEHPRAEDESDSD